MIGGKNGSRVPRPHSLLGPLSDQPTEFRVGNSMEPPHFGLHYIRSGVYLEFKISTPDKIVYRPSQNSIYPIHGDHGWMAPLAVGIGRIIDGEECRAGPRCQLLSHAISGPQHSRHLINVS
ncbi:unnamed protein product [Cuscuta epithymum]|uniref:Uncharacterized protein n=1 Tax=Cuscuta epithymum TaxID=186058 RepID=A0AAV0D2Y2_9ASTE|nr:unnamed protein product [Cuscuta epithymum]